MDVVNYQPALSLENYKICYTIYYDISSVVADHFVQVVNFSYTPTRKSQSLLTVSWQYDTYSISSI